MKTLRVMLIFAVIFVLGSSAYAAKYKMTIIAGTGANLDLAFAADGCAGICQHVTLACHCYSNVYTEKSYDFPHLTSNQRVVVEFRGGSCDGEVYTVGRVSGSGHDTRCFTCVDGEFHVYDPACPPDQAKDLQSDGDEEGGEAGAAEADALR